MPEEFQPHAAPHRPAQTNPSVAHCLHIFNSVHRTERTRGENDYSARQIAGLAYRNALPPLDGHDNIRNFIACVAQGILIGAIDLRQSSKLIHAAQVALAAGRAQPARPVRRESAKN